MARPRRFTDVKVCNVCKIEKPLEEFTMRLRHERGKTYGPFPMWACKKCVALRSRARYIRTGGDPDGQRRSHLKARFGLTEEDYAELLASQGGCCAICGHPESRSTKRLSVDHCHASGKVRSLLCANCNTGIGLLGDSSEVLRRAADYLDLHLSP